MEETARTVRYACCMVPVEIVMAAGFTPKRAVPRGMPSGADGRMHPGTCCYIRSLLSDALAGAFDRDEAVILANSCDGMRKLYDLWEGYVPKTPALFLDLPRKNDPPAERFFAGSLRGLAGRLADLPGGRMPDAGGLEEAIGQVNRIRAAFARVFHAMAEDGAGASGSEVFSLLTREEMPAPEELDALADAVNAGSRERKGSPNGRRVLVTGNILNVQALPAMLQGAGAAMAGFDTCFGMRHYGLLVEEGTPDPFAAVAARYLAKPPCARMMGVTDQIAFLKKTIDETRPDGVVVSQVKYCDNYAYTVPLVRQAVESSGARCLVLENDYEWSDEQKARIKVEAFMETMGQGR